MLHRLNSAGGTDISVLQRQRARMKWQQDQQQVQQQQQEGFFNENELNMFSLPAGQAQAQQFQNLISNESGFGGFVNRAVKPDPGMENNGWPDYGMFDGHAHLGYGYGNVNGVELNYAISRTTSCPPTVAAAAMVDPTGADTNLRESVLSEKLSSAGGRERFKKRKAARFGAGMQQDHRESRNAR